MANVTGAVIGLVVTIVLVVAVAIPVTQEVINQLNATGTLATVLNIIPILLGVGALVAVVTIFLR